MGKKAKAAAPKPAVLFVCVRNGGKSQLAAALMQELAGDMVTVHSAGTDPGTKLNQEMLDSLAEVGIAQPKAPPKAIDPALLASVDLVVLLGAEAQLDAGNTPTERWVTDEPSDRGITGAERMALIREDIHTRVIDLVAEFA